MPNRLKPNQQTPQPAHPDPGEEKARQAVQIELDRLRINSTLNTNVDVQKRNALRARPKLGVPETVSIADPRALRAGSNPYANNKFPAKTYFLPPDVAIRELTIGDSSPTSDERLGLIYGDPGQTDSLVLIPSGDAWQGALAYTHYGTHILEDEIQTSGSVIVPTDALRTIQGLFTHIRKNGRRV